MAVSGCDAGSAVPGASDDAPSASNSAHEESGSAATISTNVRRGAKAVPVSTLLKVNADSGRLTKVTARYPGGTLPGEISSDGTSWVASDRLEPGSTYTVRTVAEGDDGAAVTDLRRFATQALTLDQQTYPSLAPLAGETVGVGMPVVLTFDLPVSDRAAVERNLSVESQPAQAGSWHWLSDKEVHWRPRRYWKPGTEVHVEADVNGVDVGAGIFGQEDRSVDFTIGDAHIYRVNARTHQMKVFANGKLIRTIPITTGKPGFTTRSGTKVIMEKFDVKRMNSETVGIPAGSSEAYDIDDVQWAMRVTNSGEFIHAAPWSVGSQGYANVSHGCTGLSTDNAKWLYDMTRRGDVVEYTGTDRPMEPDNGYGDWNIPYPTYKDASAL